MKKEVEYTNEAIKDLSDIEEYISLELGNARSAYNIVENIIARIEGLADMPEIGAPLSARMPFSTDYRYLVCGNYTVFYLIEKNTVRISRVIYGRRNFMSLLFDK